MAVAFDANLGSLDQTFAPGGVVTLTTTAAAAAAARVVVFASYFSGAGAVSSAMTVAGTSCVMDKRTTNGQDYFEVWSCHRAATTAISSSIQMAIVNTALGGVLLGAASFIGVLATGAFDVSAQATGTGASWVSGSATNAVADSLYIGGVGTEDTVSHTNVAVNGIEIHDRYRAADGQGMATGYLLASTTASQNVSGTLSNSSSTNNTSALAVYKGSGVAAAALTLPPSFNPIPLMGR